jgi:hypothetical protein
MVLGLVIHVLTRPSSQSRPLTEAQLKAKLFSAYFRIFARTLDFRETENELWKGLCTIELDIRGSNPKSKEEKEASVEIIAEMYALAMAAFTKVRAKAYAVQMINIIN